jgi:hypothetical protein
MGRQRSGSGQKKGENMNPAKLRIAVAAAISLTLTLTAARAATPTTTGDAEILHEPPDDVRTGRLEDNSRAIIFAEQTDFTTEGPLKVDVSRPGEVVKLERRVGRKGRPKRGTKKLLNLSPSVIAAGKRVNSYFIHFDPVGKAVAELDATGSITFDEEVIGIIITGEKLVASNDIVGLSTTQYPGGQAQAAELTKGTRLTLSADKRTVSFTLRASNATDNLRIITEAEAEEPPKKKKTGSKKGDMSRDNQANAVDLLPMGTLWIGQRTALNQSEVWNCKVVVKDRKGDLVHLELSQWPAFRVQLIFRLQKNRGLVLVNSQYIGGRHLKIEGIRAKGSTNGQQIAIDYSWTESTLNANRKKTYKNRHVEGVIEVELQP